MSAGHEVADVTVTVEPERVESVVPASSDVSKGMPGKLPDLLGGVDTTAPSEPETHAVAVGVRGSECVQTRDERLDRLRLVRLR